MAQRTLAQWQQHSAEETICIILCVHTGMSAWRGLNKRGFLCLSIIVCSLFLTYKNPPYCYSTFFRTWQPSPRLFFFFFNTSCWNVSWRSLPWILIWRSTSTVSLPLFVLFLSAGHRQHKVTYFPARRWNKKTLFNRLGWSLLFFYFTHSGESCSDQCLPAAVKYFKVWQRQQSTLIHSARHKPKQKHLPSTCWKISIAFSVNYYSWFIYLFFHLSASFSPDWPSHFSLS